ncbi:hypothetical protein [Streptomyces mirabilis]|uniref:hypothetical protein n=1 Tax=Streptomyces mirabilis TaxID=68239 RepID=UPI00368A31E0
MLLDIEDSYSNVEFASQPACASPTTVYFVEVLIASLVSQQLPESMGVLGARTASALTSWPLISYGL